MITMGGGRSPTAGGSRLRAGASGSGMRQSMAHVSRRPSPPGPAPPPRCRCRQPPTRERHYANFKKAARRLLVVNPAHQQPRRFRHLSRPHLAGPGRGRVRVPDRTGQTAAAGASLHSYPPSIGRAEFARWVGFGPVRKRREGADASASRLIPEDSTALFRAGCRFC